MSFFSRTVGALRPAYMIRAYVIGFAFLGFMAWIRLDIPENNIDTISTNDVYWLVYYLICSLLFPFSKLVWDEVADMLLGRNAFYMNAFIFVFLKLLINMLLWGFAVFVAPLGIGYLWYRSREVSASGQ